MNVSNYAYVVKNIFLYFLLGQHETNVQAQSHFNHSATYTVPSSSGSFIVSDLNDLRYAEFCKQLKKKK